MPPEVMEAGDYNSSLDVFSFGHLMLFTIIGEVPGSLLGPTYSDLDGIRGRSEIDRRRKYVVKSQKQLGQTHPLNILMEGCLRNVPSKRPSTEVLVQTLCHVVRFIVSSPQTTMYVFCPHTLHDKPIAMQSTVDITLCRCQMKKLTSTFCCKHQRRNR
jgi:hypothetical protein